MFFCTCTWNRTDCLAGPPYSRAKGTPCATHWSMIPAHHCERLCTFASTRPVIASFIKPFRHHRCPFSPHDPAAVRPREPKRSYTVRPLTISRFLFVAGFTNGIWIYICPFLFLRTFQGIFSDRQCHNFISLSEFWALTLNLFNLNLNL